MKLEPESEVYAKVMADLRAAGGRDYHTGMYRPPYTPTAFTPMERVMNNEYRKGWNEAQAAHESLDRLQSD